MNNFRRVVRRDNAGATPAESEGHMSITMPNERDALVEKLAVAAAFLKFRAPHGGAYPRPAEIHAARLEIVNDPAYAKLCAPTETECAGLLRAHGFTPPVVRRINQKKT